MAGPAYQFGDFQLDCGRFELLRDGRSLRVERKPLELLILLVSRRDQLVTRAEIAQRLWSTEVFVDTEHGINTAIRKLRQLLRDDSENPKFIQTVTGMGYRFIAPTTSVGDTAADPPAPIAQTAPIAPRGTDLAPPDLSSTPGQPTAPQLPPPESPTKSLASQIAVAARFIVLTLTFILMAMGPRKIAALFHRDSSSAVASLAVIPLDNLSGDPSQEYFADGMTDELITMLAKDSTLRITSRTSVMQYKGARRPLSEIARALNVDAILEGSVSRSPDHVHLNLQLIRADTDAHLWAESYNRSTNDAVPLPDEAARAIADRLHSTAPTHPAQPYVNPAAHDAFLRGHYFWMVGRNPDSGKAFEQAVTIQPDYAPGWAGLSEYYSVGTLNGELDPHEFLPKAEDAGRKAVDLDPSFAQAHNVLGAAVLFNHWDTQQALHEVTRASELDPQYGEAYHLRAKILCSLGRNDEAIAVQKQSTAVNPVEHPGAMAEIYLCTRNYDAAIAEGRLRLQDFPVGADILDVVAAAYHWKGMNKEAAETLARFEAAIGDVATAAAMRKAYETGGYPAVIRCDIAAWQKRSRSNPFSTVEVARLYGILGDHEKTMALLEQANREHAPLLIFWLQTDPSFDPVHKDPRYQAIVKAIGLPPT